MDPPVFGPMTNVLLGTYWPECLLTYSHIVIPTNWLRLPTGFAHASTSCAKSPSSFQTRDNNNNNKNIGSGATPHQIARASAGWFPVRPLGGAAVSSRPASAAGPAPVTSYQRHRWRHGWPRRSFDLRAGEKPALETAQQRLPCFWNDVEYESSRDWNIRIVRKAHVGMATNCYASFSPNSLQSHSFSSSSVPHALSQACSPFLPAQSEHAPAGQAVLDPAVWRHSRLTNGRDRGRSQTRCADSDSTHLCGGRPGRKRVSAAGGRGRVDPFCWYSMDKLF